MIRPFLKRVLPQVFVCAAMATLGGWTALAQDANAGAGQRSDGQIEMDVVHALDASQALKNDLITAATVQSEVTLSGTVASEASKELAESIASHVQGVSKVHNKLNVGNPQVAEQAAADSQAQDATADQMSAEAQPEETQAPASVQANPPLPETSQSQAASPSVAAPSAPSRPAYQPNPGTPQNSAPQYEQMRQPAPSAYKTATGPVTVPQGALFILRSSEPVSSKKAKDGTPVEFVLIRDVAVGGVLAIPRGATVHGVVVEAKKAGELAGSAQLSLKLTSLELGGQTYPLDSDEFKVKGPNKAGQTAGSALAGGMLGTIIGCAAGRGVGCAVGAGAGLAAGTAASAASSGPGVWIPAEARVDFHLNTPLTVNPVSAQEASRMAQGLNQSGPTLQRRAYGPYGNPGYGYPPIYYRPYYMTGGFYYWR
jgi:hypothetical protein